MAEHFSKLDAHNKDSALFKHWQIFHQEMEEPPGYAVKVLSSHGSATERQITEALLIEKGDYHNILNSKAEWGRNSIPRQRTVFEDCIEPQTEPVNRGTKRGIIGGDEKRGTNSAPRSGAEIDFQNQFSQRKRRRRIEQKELEAEKGRTIVGGRQSMSTDRELRNMEPERPDSRQESILDRREVVRNGKENLKAIQSTVKEMEPIHDKCTVVRSLDNLHPAK